MPATVCLNMIVKNETPVIRRCLDSVRPFIDRWVIVDTGSTDGTQDMIRQHFADIPGELHERPWRDFAHNRTEALELARGQADYLLFIDADEILRVAGAFAWPALDADAYFLHVEYAGTIYSRCALVSTRLEWRWVGVLHEYLTSTPEAQKGNLDWPRIVVSHDGARARDPDTYRKDAEILEKALRDEPDNARYAFYLAQTWRDAGEPLKARTAYRRRAAMPGWDEETWMALYEIGRMAEALRAPIGEIQAAYLAAYQFRPRRAEPLYQLARFHRERGEFALAYMFAKQAVTIARPADLLFIDESVYLWRSLDELSVAASYVDALDEGKAATERLLAEGHVPPHERPRVDANLGFFVGAIEKRQASVAVPASLPAVRIAWTIWIVTPPGYDHSLAFAEIARGLQEAFAELGEVAPIVHDPKAIVGRALVLGANLLPRVPDIRIPDDAVVFNLEQVSDSGVWINESYLGILRTHEVWDYSESNIAALRARGVERVRQCAIGYAPCLTGIAPAVEEDIDVLFVGSIDGRRIPILDAIEAAGLRVHRLFGVYGAHRDAWIARAKIVLNLHAYPEQVFEIARVSYLLANRRFVISEPGRGTDRVEAMLREGVVFGTEDELPELCRRFAVDEPARRAVAKRGFELFCAMRQVDFLKSALEIEGQDIARPAAIEQQAYYEGLNEKLLAAIPADARRVLEFGCANGRLGEACKRQNPALRWTGIERSANAAAVAAGRIDEVVLMDLDAPVLSRLGNGYDVVVLGDILEHLRDPEALLRVAHDISAPDARLVCCVPNMAHASVIERMLAGDLSYDAAGLLDETHLRFLSPASTFKLLLDAGWMPNLRDSYVVGHPNQGLVNHLVAAAMQVGISQYAATNNILAYQLIIDCIKAPAAREPPATTPFSVVVPVNRVQQFELNARRSPGLAEVGAEIIPVEGAANAAEALTAGRVRASHRWIVYCHQDVYFPRGTGKAIAALLGSIPEADVPRALIGFAGLGIGADGQPGYAGLVIDRRSRFDHPESAHAVSLDELAIAVAADSVHEIDPGFGWHIWATDLCLAALHRRGTGPARIVRIPLFHNSFGDFSLPPAFHASIAVLNEKWRDLGAIATLNGTFGAPV